MKLKGKNKLMIIDITKDLDNNFKIIFTQKIIASGDNFKGLMLFTFKTDSAELFCNFKRYGRWMREEDRDAILLLRLFNKSKQNTTSYNIL